MRLRKVDCLFVAAALLVVVGVSLLPSPKDRNPPIPPTVEHQAVKGEKDCLQCHTSTEARPLSGRHPKRQDCFRCHARGERN